MMDEIHTAMLAVATWGLLAMGVLMLFIVLAALFLYFMKRLSE
jgi:hypothetical protein